jgi:phthalate 4,5-cis-dihydrodiol dehydrogenase
MTALRLGVVGLGEAATEFLPAYSRHPHVELVACADLRDVARDRFARDFSARAYDNLEELCAQPDIDVIVVSTNHELHADHVCMAAAHGKHVIVEKPIALNLADCDRMIEACERNNVLLLGGHNHSYDPATRKMREIIRSGELGRLCMINAWNCNEFMMRPYPADHLEQSRGIVLNQGPHHIDMLRLLGGGRLRSVRAVAANWDADRTGEGAYVAFFEFEDGTPATLVYNGYGFFDTSEMMGWLGEGGAPRIPGFNALARQEFHRHPAAERERIIETFKEGRRYGSLSVGEDSRMPHGWEKGGKPNGDFESHQPRFGFFLVTCAEGDMRQSADGIRIHSDELRDVSLDGMARGRQAEIDELYNAVRFDRPLVHNGPWCKATVEASLAMLESSRERREIMLSHQVALTETAVA